MSEHDAKAVDYLLVRITRDPELAYLIGNGTEAFRLLTEAHAQRAGITHEDSAKIWWDRVRISMKPKKRGL